jgi:hypothetical protein
MLVILGDDGGSVSVMMIRGSEDGPSLLFVKARTDSRYLVNGAVRKFVLLSQLFERNRATSHIKLQLW